MSEQDQQEQLAEHQFLADTLQRFSQAYAQCVNFAEIIHRMITEFQAKHASADLDKVLSALRETNIKAIDANGHVMRVTAEVMQQRVLESNGRVSAVLFASQQPRVNTGSEIWAILESASHRESGDLQ